MTWKPNEENVSGRKWCGDLCQKLLIENRSFQGRNMDYLWNLRIDYWTVNTEDSFFFKGEQ